jgi:hypothetical protein
LMINQIYDQSINTLQGRVVQYRRKVVLCDIGEPTRQ